MFYGWTLWLIISDLFVERECSVVEGAGEGHLDDFGELKPVRWDQPDWSESRQRWYCFLHVLFGAFKENGSIQAFIFFCLFCKFNLVTWNMLNWKTSCVINFFPASIYYLLSSTHSIFLFICQSLNLSFVCQYFKICSECAQNKYGLVYF